MHKTPSHLLTFLPTWGSIAWYRELVRAEHVVIDAHEHFVKSTYRNRYEVAGPNGALTLSVPKKGGKDRRAAYRDARISYDHPWQADHWKTLTAGYRRSPYFEYYEDGLRPFYETSWTGLFAYNRAALEHSLDLLGLDVDIEWTERYEGHPAGLIDRRSALERPRDRTVMDAGPRYPQVFEEKTGFLENLSILDLLFCEGPNARAVLEA